MSMWSGFSHISFARRIIANSFNNDKTFQNVLNHSFESFINLSQRSPEYISLFMDDKLRKGLKSMNEDDVEGVLDRVMMLFRYLQDKDLFEKYYKQHLAKRLLSGRTVRHWSAMSQLLPVCPSSAGAHAHTNSVNTHVSILVLLAASWLDSWNPRASATPFVRLVYIFAALLSMSTAATPALHDLPQSAGAPILS